MSFVCFTHPDAPDSALLDLGDGTVLLVHEDGTESPRQQWSVAEFKTLGWREEIVVKSTQLVSLSAGGRVTGTVGRVLRGWAKKGVQRHIATAEGVRKYGGSIGDLITADMEEAANGPSKPGRSRKPNSRLVGKTKDLMHGAPSTGGGKPVPGKKASSPAVDPNAGPSKVYGHRSAPGVKLHVFDDGTFAIEDESGISGQRQKGNLPDFEALGWTPAGEKGVKPPARAGKDPAGALMAEMKAKHPDVQFHMTSLGDGSNTVRVGLVSVPKELQGAGKAKYAMADLVKAADREQVRLAITPEPSSGDTGTSANKLKSWMRELGFVENKGKDQDFEITDSMYREPGAAVKDSAKTKTNPRVIPPTVKHSGNPNPIKPEKPEEKKTESKSEPAKKAAPAKAAPSKKPAPRKTTSKVQPVIRKKSKPALAIKHGPMQLSKNPNPTGPMTDKEFRDRQKMVEEVIGGAVGQYSSHALLAPDGVWPEDRVRQQHEILDYFYTPAESVPNDGRAIIAGGLGGSGKTTVLSKYAGVDQSKYLTVNSDDIKEEMIRRGMVPKVPGHEDLSSWERAALIHEESSTLAKRLIDRASSEKKNMIVDTTMGSRDSIIKTLGKLTDRGYKDIDGVFVDIPAEKSVGRALARYRRGEDDRRAGHGFGGRFVPPSIIRKQVSPSGKTTLNRETFDALAPKFAHWSVYDNGVDGREPKEIARGTSAKIAVDRTPHRTTGAKFHEAVSAAVDAKGGRGAFVSVYEPEEYAKMRTFSAEGGKVGGALKDHGDGRIEMVSLFNNGGSKGAGLRMMDHLIANGGNYLEAYGDTLRGLYETRGFEVETKNVFVDEFASPDWDYAEYGRPPYYTMLAKGMKGKVPSPAERDSLSSEPDRAQKDIGKIVRGLVRRREAQSHWGASHSGSFDVTGASAKLMGAKGYRRLTSDDRSSEVQGTFVAARLMREIQDGSTVADGRRFHGTGGKQWDDVKPGQTVDVPLTATSDRLYSAAGYGNSGAHYDNEQDLGYVIVFPKGTHGAGITEDEDINTGESIPGKWGEMVVAGQFRVRSRAKVSDSEGNYTRIELEPAGYFNLDTKQFDAVEPTAPEPDYGHPEIVARLRDQGAQINSDGTVSVWTRPNTSRFTAEERPTIYTTSKERADEWNSGDINGVKSEGKELRIPLSEAVIESVYSNEAQLLVPESLVPDRKAKESDKARKQGTDLSDYVRSNAGKIAAAQQEHWDRSSYGDPQILFVGKKQGFNDKPVVGSPEDLDAAVVGGWIEIFRGFDNSRQASREDQIDALRGTGGGELSYIPGRGIYGNGTYTSVSHATAMAFSRGRLKPGQDSAGGVLRMALNPRAHIAEAGSVKREQSRLMDSLHAITDQREWTDAELSWGDFLSDEGRVAAMLGYDAIHYTGVDDGVGTADQYVLLNRTAVLMQVGERGDFAPPKPDEAPADTKLVEQADVRKAETGEAANAA